VEVPLDATDGMPQSCVVNLDEILIIPKTSLVSRLTTLSHQKMTAVTKAAQFALEL
jgi:mRNA-degrading endonuclease toxin of MazEF toxin-antitoxin module